MIHFTVEDGLPSNTVYSIYRDKTGFLWIATDKGIARYNGIKFETFTTFDGLPDNEIFFFREDFFGRLWLGTYNGELCYFKNDTFHTAANTPFLKLSFKNSFIQDIQIEKDSSVTFYFYNRDLLCLKNEEMRHISFNINFSSGKHAFGEKIGKNRFRLIYNDRILLIDSNGMVKENKLLIDSKGKPFTIKPTFDEENRYFFNDEYIYDKNLNIVKNNNTKIAGNYIFNSASKSDIGWLMATNNGLLINDSINILKNTKISHICRDNVMNYYISTVGSGIYKLSKDFMGSNLVKNAYDGKISYSFSDNRSVFYVCTDQVTKIYQLSHQKPTVLYHYKSVVKRKDVFSSAFLIDTNHHFYNCGDSEVIDIKNLSAAPLVVNKFEVTKYELPELNSLYTIKAILLRDKHLIINATRSLLDLDLSKLGITSRLPYKDINGTIKPERIFCIAKSDDGDIWYSDIKDVYKLNNNTAIPQQQFKRAAFKSFIFWGRYLIGYTHNNQLLICKNINSNISIDTIKSQNCIWENFYKLDSAHLLISTNNTYRLLTCSSDGKFEIRPIENQFIPSGAEAICTDDRSCYFFKNSAIISQDIRSILEKPAPPTLFFSTVRIGKKTFTPSDSLQIPYDQSKNITITYTALSFNSKNIACQFSVVSKGDTGVWRNVTGDALNLYNLGYGYHTINLRAKTTASDYSRPIILSFYIRRPFWATWWFATICTASFVLLLVFFTRMRIRYIVKKNQKAHASEVKFMKSEYKALNALMNPHFIFNTLNNVQSLVNDNNKRAANEYLRVFADLIRQNMHNISKELIPLQKEIDLVSNYLALEKLRFEDKISYTINIDDDFDISETMVPPLLIQPLVENSIKHGILTNEKQDGLIVINVYKKNDALYIEVRDNGNGPKNNKKEPDSRHESFGLENIKTRIRQLSIIQGKNITFSMNEIKSEAGIIEGTVVTISIPVD